MKRWIFLITLISLLISGNANAITYFHYWVNGSQSQVMTQGDLLAWEADVAAPGNTLTLTMYVDVDGDHLLTSIDRSFGSFTLKDGDPQPDGPADSSSVPDGLLYVQFGPFGFAPQNYIMEVADEDGSHLTTWFSVNEMANPAATISGHIILEGLTPPDAQYANVMVGAMSMEGIFSGLSDSTGAYHINLTVADTQWDVSVFFDENVPGFVAPGGTTLLVPASGVSGVDFFFSKPSAFVYGDVRDENGTILPIAGGVGLRNAQTDSWTGTNLENGHFLLPAVLTPGDSVSQFFLQLEGNNLFPDYLLPREIGPINVHAGDSLNQDITVWSTDSKIYGYVAMNGQAPQDSFKMEAYTDTFGTMYSYSDATTGYFELSVRGGNRYWVGIQTDQHDGTPLPDGYVIEGGNSTEAHAGDTVYVNLIPAGNLISGIINFDAGDPVPPDQWFGNAGASDNIGSGWFNGDIDSTFHYTLLVPNGEYSVSINFWDGEYLTLPDYYPNVPVQQDTIDTLNFLANYRHANLTVKLTNAPLPDWFDSFGINTQGNWPMIYQSWEQMDADTVFHFRVCEGDWMISDPINDPAYVTNMEDTIVHVTEADSSYFVEFRYQSLTGIGAQKAIPTTFFMKQNYPNPFNPQTRIEYGLAENSKVKLVVYNVIGEKIATLVDAAQTAGTYSVNWQPENIASGVYIFRLETGSFVQSRKMIYMR